MGFSVLKHTHNDGDSIHYDPHLRRYFETYMAWLRNHSKSTVLAVDDHTAYKYEGDFYGLLAVMGVSHHLHWLVLRVNDLTNPMDFDQSITGITVPDPKVIQRIVQRYRSLIKKRGL